MKGHNLVGPQVRKLRYDRGWSQAQLAIQLQLKGLDVGREVVAQVEGQCHCVKDKGLPYFAQAFGVSLIELFPPFDAATPVHDAIQYLLKTRETRRPRRL
jgi:ribosome-binding protein aMBF1 (putative translation factor)